MEKASSSQIWYWTLNHSKSKQMFMFNIRFLELLSMRSNFLGSSWNTSNGCSALFWCDYWCGDAPLKHHYPKLYDLVVKKLIVVVDYAREFSFLYEEWDGFFSREFFYCEKALLFYLCSLISSVILLPNILDRLIWKLDDKGVFSVHKLSDFISSVDVDDTKVNYGCVWNIPKVPKIQCFLWVVYLSRIPTLYFLKDRKIILSEE